MATPEQQRQAQPPFISPVREVGRRSMPPPDRPLRSLRFGTDHLLPGRHGFVLDLVMALEPGVEAQVRRAADCLLIPHSEFPMHRARSTAIIDPRWV